MSSILTNASAMTALQTLNQINKDLSTTQSRISTGLRVAEASDNSAYWSIATTMRSDNKAMSTVQDALGLGAAQIDVAYTAMDSVKDYLDEIKTRLVAAKQPGVDKTKIQAEIDQLKEQITGISQSASFSGSNWLSINSDTDDTEQTIVSSFSRASDGTVSVGTITIDTADIALFDAGAGNGLLEAEDAAALGIADIDLASLDADAGPTIDDFISAVENMTDRVTSAAADLGAYKSRVDMQKDFVTALMDAVDRGVGQLVDADMNQESTRLQALQVQQQLGIQALSIANSSSQSILSLFR